MSIVGILCYINLQNIRILHQDCSFPLLSEKTVAEFIDEEQVPILVITVVSKVICVGGWMARWTDNLIYIYVFAL